MENSISAPNPPNLSSKIYGFFRYSIPYRIVGIFVKLINRPIQFDSYKIEFPPSKIVKYGAYFFNDYEKEERRLIKKYLNTQSVVLELGGCLGVVSNLINSILAHPENHIVLEPNPNMTVYLEKNKMLNNSKYTIENSLISEEKEIEFNIYDDYLGSSIYSRKPGSNAEKVIIECTTVKNLESKHNLKFDVLIMDIEGSELEVIQHTDLSNINLLIVEFHYDVLGETGHNEYCDILRKNGFELKKTLGTVECWKKN